MRHRWAQVAISLLMTAAAYQLYAQLFVPVIEPQSDAMLGHEQVAAPAEQILEQRMKDLARFFPHRREMLKRAKIFEIDQSTLIFQEYWNLGDGRILVRPCMLVLRPPETSSSSPKNPALPSTMVVETADGAIFQFDRPIDLRSARFGRFISGQLLGSIVIRGYGGEQDFRATTRDVTLTEHRVWTNQSLELLWGRHRLRGSGMEVVFQGRSPFSGTGDKKSDLQVERFILRHVDRIHLDVNSLGPTTSLGPLGSNPLAAGKFEESLELACTGPLLYVPQKRTVSLEEQVEVNRVQQNETILNLTCSRLTLLLGELVAPARPKGDPASAENTPPAPSSPRTSSVKLIQALGKPVRTTLPRWKAEILCEDLRYDADQGVLSLDSSQGVTLKRGSDHFSAPRMQCQLTPQGELKTLAAAGPGKVQSEPEGEVLRRASAFWGQALLITFSDRENLVSLQGNVRVEANPLGILQCQRLWCWLDPSDKSGAKNSDLQPRRMVAEDHVRITSSQLQAETERLESWFTAQSSLAAGEKPTAGSSSAAGARGNPAANPLAAGNLSPAAGPTASSLPALTAPTKGDNENTKREASKFQVAARLLRVEFGNIAGQWQLSNLSADGTVKLLEQRSTDNQAPGLQIFGEHLEVLDVSGLNTIFSLTGSPAYLSGGGASLSGQQVFVDQRRNLVSTSGPGRIQVIPSATSSLSPMPATTQASEMQWTSGMDFDGQIVRFKGDVELTSGNRRVQADALEVEVDPPIRLADRTVPNNLQISSAHALGHVAVENVELASSGEVNARDRLLVSEITVNLKTGELVSPGAGRFLTVRTRGGLPPSLLPTPASQAGATGAPPPTVAPASNAASNVQNNSVAGQSGDERDSPRQADNKIALDVSYYQDLQANIYRRSVTCRGRVIARYGIASDWIQNLSDDPRELGKDGLVLRCEDLSVYQLLTPADTKPHLELDARGNVTVEGQNHAARARRLCFDESKYLLVLEGDGEVPAELYRQEFLGGPVQRTAARRIFFWYQNKTIKVDDIKSLEVSQSPTYTTGR